MHVHLRLGGESYALPVANVIEVVELGLLTALPGGDDAVLGLRNLRGQVLPVFDLATLLGVAGDRPVAQVCIAQREGLLAGFAVDQVTDVAALPPGGDETDDALLERTLLVGGTLVGVIDVERMFEELEHRGGA